MDFPAQDEAPESAVSPSTTLDAGLAKDQEQQSTAIVDLHLARTAYSAHVAVWRL